MSSGQPQRFGPYVILDRIGDGGMAEIFLAKMLGYSGFEKLIALKRIHPKYSANETFAQMLIHEAKLAAALSHFNVVQVLDLGEIDGQVFIAMEYVRGRDLAAVLSNTYRRDERLPVELSVFIATEFITGLEYAHRRRDDDGSLLGIIHRDISPQNVLISYEGEVKVTDFGIARVFAGKLGTFQLPGNMHGKFGYMSPEQAQNLDIDQRSDVFSAGVVLWEMLVGARLFRGQDQFETVAQVTSGDIPPPSSRNPAVPPEVDAICMKALARDREHRYQTMGALLGDLSRASDGLPRRAGSRDLSVYMRRQFGTSGGGFRPGRTNSSRPDTGNVRISAGDPKAPEVGPGRMPIGQILLEQGAIDMGQLELALAEQRAKGGRIGEVLVSIAAIDDAALAQALAQQANLPSISTRDLVALPPPNDLLARFPKDAAESACVLPIPDGNGVRLAVCDPYDERAVLEAKVVLGMNDVHLTVAPRSAIREAVSSWYQSPPEAQPAPELPTVPRVLVADADASSAAQLASRLEAEGFEVDVVHDGREARRSLETRPPTIALLDASLPRIDGYNLLLELRSRQEDIAVFITSERDDEFRQAKALELGADDFLPKPHALDLTASKVRREVQRRGSPTVRPAPSLASGVSGSLADMTVLDILQSLELGRKTAHVVVQYEDGRQGELRVDDGQLRGCDVADRSGAPAFYLLSRPGPGLFRIEYKASPLPVNVDQPNTFLIIEAMRLLDEAVGPSDDIEVVVQDPVDASIDLGAQLAGDLTLDDLGGAQPGDAETDESLLRWIDEQLEAPPRGSGPVRPSEGTEVARIKLRSGDSGD